jgi:hypothetical protein
MRQGFWGGYDDQNNQVVGVLFFSYSWNILW